jgi:hypothetical protein
MNKVVTSEEPDAVKPLKAKTPRHWKSKSRILAQLIKAKNNRLKTSELKTKTGINEGNLYMLIRSLKNDEPNLIEVNTTFYRNVRNSKLPENVISLPYKVTREYCERLYKLLGRKDCLHLRRVAALQATPSKKMDNIICFLRQLEEKDVSAEEEKMRQKDFIRFGMMHQELDIFTQAATEDIMLYIQNCANESDGKGKLIMFMAAQERLHKHLADLEAAKDDPGIPPRLQMSVERSLVSLTRLTVKYLGPQAEELRRITSEEELKALQAAAKRYRNDYYGLVKVGNQRKAYDDMVHFRKPERLAVALQLQHPSKPKKYPTAIDAETVEAMHNSLEVPKRLAALIDEESTRQEVAEAREGQITGARNMTDMLKRMGSNECEDKEYEEFAKGMAKLESSEKNEIKTTKQKRHKEAKK